MAATLIRIKAQMLFPRRSEEEEEDPRAELVRRLLEYEHFREAARLLDEAERERARFHARGYVPPRPVPPRWTRCRWRRSGPRCGPALERLAERLHEPEPGYRIAGRPVRMEEKIDYVLAALGGALRVEFAALVAPWGTRMHAVMSLLACLELSKRSALRLRQREPFAPLWIYRGEEANDAT